MRCAGSIHVKVERGTEHQQQGWCLMEGSTMSTKRMWHPVHPHGGLVNFGYPSFGTAEQVAFDIWGKQVHSLLHAEASNFEVQVIVHDSDGRLVGTLFHMASPKMRYEWLKANGDERAAEPRIERKPRRPRQAA